MNKNSCCDFWNPSPDFFGCEKVAKSKKRAVLSLRQFWYGVKLLAPPRVEILRGKIYSEPRRIFAFYSFSPIIQKACLKSNLFAPIARLQSLTGFRNIVSPRGSTQFLRGTSKNSCGERRAISSYYQNWKSDKPSGFLLFLQLFLAYKKKLIRKKQVKGRFS